MSRNHCKLTEDCAAVPENIGGMYLRDGLRLYVVSPKAGLTSLGKYFRVGAEGPVTYTEALTFFNITFVIRNPDVRLLSAWRNKFLDYTIEEVIDVAIDLPITERNLHLAPQSWFFGDLQPARVLTMAQLSKELHGLPHVNSSDAGKHTMPDYRRDELRAAYAADWELFNSTL